MSARSVITWLIPLKGHEFDLEDLPIYLHGSLISVAKRGESHYLHIPARIVGPDSERVGPTAEGYVSLLNGLSAILVQDHHPIEIDDGGILGIDEQGETAVTVLSIQSAVSRVKAGHLTLAVGGVTSLDSRTGTMAPLLREVLANRTKADALAIVGRALPTWSELFVVFELVEGDVGGRMYDEAWITRADANLFTRTANNYTALGVRSRHGKPQWSAPLTPMTQRAALALLRSLVTRWLTDGAASATGD